MRNINDRPHWAGFFMRDICRAADSFPHHVHVTLRGHSARSSAQRARYRIDAVTQMLENIAMRSEINADSIILSDFALLC